jgi:uncharacterized protein
MSLEELDDYLSSDEAPPECMLLSDLDGFLTGLAVGQEMIPPSEWLPVVWGGETPRFDDEAQAQAVLGAIMGRYNEIVRQIDEEMPQPILWRFDETVIAADWAYGFAQAIALRPRPWMKIVKSDAGMLLVPIMMLSEAEALFDDLDLDIEEEDEAVDDAIAILPATILAIADYWRMSASQRKSFVAGMSSVSRPGRNDPCPCGSGRKFKKCCGANP